MPMKVIAQGPPGGRVPIQELGCNFLMTTLENTEPKLWGNDSQVDFLTEDSVLFQPGLAAFGRFMSCFLFLYCFLARSHPLFRYV